MAKIIRQAQQGVSKGSLLKTWSRRLIVEFCENRVPPRGGAQPNESLASTEAPFFRD